MKYGELKNLDYGCPPAGNSAGKSPENPFGNLVSNVLVLVQLLHKGGSMVTNPNDFGDIVKLASELITAIHNTTRSGDSNSQTLPNGLSSLLNLQGSLVADLRKLAEWCEDIYYANSIASTK